MPGDILVIAETEALTETMAARLRESGRSVTVTSSVRAAVEKLRDLPIEIALIESTVLSDESDELRYQIRALRPRCQPIMVNSFDHVRKSGSLLHFGKPDYILGGTDLLRLICAASANDETTPLPDRQSSFVQSFTKVLEVLIGLQEVDDRYFAGFTKRVSRLACAVADEMRLPSDVREGIAIACLLRDIGKAGVRPDILSEQDKLTPHDVTQIRTHVLWSVRLLEHIEFPGKVLSIIRHHHERYDGSGYPDGLKGREIPLGSRIIAAAETFAAMTSERPHRPARSGEKATEELMSAAGTQLDPEIVEVVLKVLRGGAGMVEGGSLILVIEPDREFRRLVRMRLLNDGHEVVVTDQCGELHSLVPRTPELVLLSTAIGVDGVFQYMNRSRVTFDGNRVPFALIVSEDDRQLRLRALREGVDDIFLKSDDLEEMSARVGNILMREAAHRRVSDKRPIGLRGNLHSLSLPDMVQMLCMGRKTAAVTLTSPSGTAGIWFLGGAIVHAECGTLRGDRAFYALMGWHEAEFLIQHGVEAGDRSIDTDPMFLLMEHLRNTDEGNPANTASSSDLRLDEPQVS